MMDDLDFSALFAQLSNAGLAALQVASSRAVDAQRSGAISDSRLALLDIACGSADECRARGLAVTDTRAPRSESQP